ncbi:hypothetical protein BJX64DRAFT_287474 [Aspergillus heterothallicus]
MDIPFFTLWLAIVAIMAIALFYPVPQRARVVVSETTTELESTSASVTTETETETSTSTPVTEVQTTYDVRGTTLMAVGTPVSASKDNGANETVVETAPATLRNSASATPSAQPQPQPYPLASLPSLFPPRADPDPTPIESIRQTLALYPLAIDSKNFSSLSLIFAPDAVANYSAPLGVLTGLPEIESVLNASLACVTTQHSLGTQVINVLSHEMARSVTYYTAAHFGKGDLSSETAVVYGQYQDIWKKARDGTWRIVGRDLVYMSGVIGNQMIFVC